MSGKRRLELVLEPPSAPAKKPLLYDHHPRLQADAHNCVEGSVNGVACRVLLDSGTTNTSVFWNTAKRLGLITGAEATTTQMMVLWSGLEKLQVVRLPSITISLGPGVEVVTPAIVLPEWLERHFRDADQVVLEACHMRRGRMVQVFRPDGSELVVRRPETLLRKMRRTRQSLMPDVLKVREAHARHAAPMTMLVDTGANDVHVSDRRRKLLTQGDKRRSLPDCISLDLGDGCYLHAGPLRRVPSAKYDFIMGTVPLGKYGAVLNYAAHELTFRVGSQWRKAQMQPSH